MTLTQKILSFVFTQADFNQNLNTNITPKNCMSIIDNSLRLEKFNLSEISKYGIS